MLTLSKILVTIWLGVGSLFGYHAPATLGDFNPTGGGTYRLQSSISSTQTTLTLTSFKEPVSSIAYTMSYLNSSIEYATIDPQNNNSKEFVSFTGITQNSNGTATLTGVTRGLGFSYPYTASSTLRQTHSGQSIFILSNPPQLTNQYYNLSNVSTSTNTLIFSSTTPPRYDLVPINHTLGTYVSTTSELATFALVNAISAAGCSTGTVSVTGCLRLATQLQQASSTFAAGTPTVISTANASSTFNPAGSLLAVITQNNNKIDKRFIATSSTDIYRWAGSDFFTGNISFLGSIISSSTNIFSGQNSFLGTTIMATTTSTDLRNGAGASYGGKLATLTTPSDWGTSSTATTTLISFNLPANFMATSSIIHIRLYFGDGGSQNTIINSGTFRLALNYGGVGKAYQSSSFTASVGVRGIIDATLIGNGSTGSQYGMINMTGEPNAIGNAVSGVSIGAVGTYSIDSTVGQTVSVTASFGASDGLNAFYLHGGYAEIIN